jgi:CubicO group peptidase (beta-lactamase class C family)
MPSFSKILFLLLISLLTSGTSFGQVLSTEELIIDLMEHYEAVGVSVAVVKKGKVVYTKAFGKKNIEADTPLSSTDIFRIASISKSFAATSIMQLVEQGKLSLNDDFGDLIGFPIRNPKYPEVKITLRMVLSHTSSINDSEGYFTLDAINPAKNPAWEKCYSDNQPGSTYSYCNLNYNMVGAVIEKVSGERYDEYVYKHISQPLGLNAHHNVDALDRSLFATLYEYDAATKKLKASPNAYLSRSEDLKSYQLGYTAPIFSPTGGMKISAPDLAKYMTMHMKQGKVDGVKILSKKSSQQMQTPIALKDGYGLALHKTTKLFPRQEVVGHTGSAYGLYSMMFFHPKKQYGVVAITNGCNPKQSGRFIDFLAAVSNVLYSEVIEKP